MPIILVVIVSTGFEYEVETIAPTYLDAEKPHIRAAELEDLGCKIVIWPVSSLRVAAAAVSSLYGELAASGSAKGKLNQMQSRAQLYEVIRYHDFEALDETIARSVLPEPPQ